MRLDRNFDEVADHFADKVYGGLKGDIRLAVLRRDLHDFVNKRSSQLNRPLRILDIGGGLAQLSIEFAKLGHEIIVNDISKNMIEKAKESIAVIENSGNNNASLNITWIVCPYQLLDIQLTGQFDLILNHAVLEWLAEPKDFISFAQNWLYPDGYLSLCFYNKASYVYRNLVMGNFNLLNKEKIQADNIRSLTPNHPVDKDELFKWLKDYNFEIALTSGLRVFHDYTTIKRGGNAVPEAVIEMEVKYSNQEPYKWLGRYLHILSKKCI